MRYITLISLICVLLTACKKENNVPPKTTPAESHTVDHNMPIIPVQGHVLDPVVSSFRYHGMMTTYIDMSMTSGSVTSDTAYLSACTMVFHKSGNVSFNHLRPDDVHTDTTAYIVRDSAGVLINISNNLLHPSTFGIFSPTTILINGDSIYFREVVVMSCLGDDGTYTFRGKIDR